VACANCGAGLPADARFCLQCGRAVAVATPATYTPAHLKERINAARSSMEGERKQVTVLFCDIVKSSALAAELGAEGFHALVNRFFKVGLDAVHRYEGTVNQFMGDGFMALFGAPIAHENHARRAALAAIEIRDRTEVDIRIGINSGFVVVGPIGDDLWVDYSAFGDTIILAARLQAAAQPRQILMSDTTAHMVRGYITFTPAPEVRVKERSVQPIRVIGIGPRTSRLDLPEQALSPFVGRDREIAVLREALGLASTGSGQIVGLVGEPGLGKSRIVLEFGSEAATRSTVLEGRCISFGERFAYMPLLDLVRRICGISVADEPDAVEAKLRATTATLGLDNGCAPILVYALDVPGAHSELQDLDRPTVKGQIFRAMRDLLVACATRRPLAIIIEDLHWIDPTSGDFLADFSSDIETTPILLVGTFRPGYKPPWAAKSFARQEALRPLDATASEHIVRTILGPDGQSVSQIVSRGEGNPFFLEELSRSVQERASEEMPSVPHTVHEVLAARIDRLEDERKRALQLAAVIGREFTLEVMDAVWDGQDDPLAHLQELKRLEFVRERLDAEQRTFIFKHSLTQEVAYDGLLETQRQRLHEAVGKALEHIYGNRAEEHAELLAYHYQRSAETERAVHYLALANRRAADRNAIDEAYEYYRAARELYEKLPDNEQNRRRRVRLMLDQTREYHFRFRNQEYYDLLIAHEPMVRSLSDEGLLGAFYGQLGHREHVMLFDYKRATRTLHQALELCERADNQHDATFAETLLIWTNTMLAEYDRALGHREKVRKRLASSSYDSISTNFSHAGAALVHIDQGQWPAALAETDAGIAIGRERSDTTVVSFLLFIRSVVQLERGDPPGALESAQSSLAIAPTEYFRGFAQLMIARALGHMGQLEHSLRIQSALSSFFESYRHLFVWLFFAPGLIEDQIAAGGRDEARALLDRVEEAANRGPAPLYAGKCRRLRAELGQLPADKLREGLPELRRIGAENELARSLVTLARLEAQAGHSDAALAAKQEAHAIFERLGTIVEQPSMVLGS
jgi:class 3 adenylate cyclase/tetratricopeptide (TPR) repeat protein